MTASYASIRQRHIDYATALLPEYLQRLAWSRAQIDAEQARALRALVAHAVERSDWHRARLGDVDVARLTRDGLAGLPVMTKHDLMTHWDAIVTDPRCSLAGAEAHLAGLITPAYYADEHHVIASGGSSGTRGVFVYDWHGWTVSFLGLARGLLRTVAHLGRSSADGPLAAVAAHAPSHATSAIPSTFALPSLQHVFAPVTQPLAQIVETLNRGRPLILLSYASMLATLCDEARAGRLQIAPAIVWSTSEPLLPEVRARVAATWPEAVIMNAWAASESNGGAFGCHVGPGFHIGEDVNVIELVDEHGAPVAPGERASRILLTNLYNRVMPLVRYEIPDEFRLASAPCPCGSAFVKVDDVHGRTDDVFEYDGGVRVHPLNFRTVLGKHPAIVEYQVRQTARGAEVDVVGGEVDVASLGTAITHRLRAVGLPHPAVGVHRVDGIRRQATGKLKRFVPLAAAAP